MTEMRGFDEYYEFKKKFLKALSIVTLQAFLKR